MTTVNNNDESIQCSGFDCQCEYRIAIQRLIEMMQANPGRNLKVKKIPRQGYVSDAIAQDEETIRQFFGLNLATEWMDNHAISGALA